MYANELDCMYVWPQYLMIFLCKIKNIVEMKFMKSFLCEDIMRWQKMKMWKIL